MPTTQYSTIKTAIEAKLATITKIQRFHSYPKGDPNGFPACIFMNVQIASDPIDSASQMRTMIYTYQIIQEVEKDATGASAGETIIAAIIDDLLNAFDADWQLSCAVDSAFITRLKTDNIMRENFMRVIEFDITVQKTYTP